MVKEPCQHFRFHTLFSFSQCCCEATFTCATQLNGFYAQTINKPRAISVDNPIREKSSVWNAIISNTAKIMPKWTAPLAVPATPVTFLSVFCIMPQSQMGCNASAMGKIQQISSKSCDISRFHPYRRRPSCRLRRIAEILGIGKPAAVPSAGLKSWRSVARFWSFFGHPRRILRLTTAPSD